MFWANGMTYWIMLISILMTLNSLDAGNKDIAFPGDLNNPATRGEARVRPQVPDLLLPKTGARRVSRFETLTFSPRATFLRLIFPH